MINNLRFATLFCFLIFSIDGFSQQLAMYKTFGGVRFERDSLFLSARQVNSILQDQPEAYKLFKKARTNASVGSVLGFVGGLLIGIPIGTAISGGEPEWGIALGGAALIGVGIPFNIAYTKNAKNAIDLYNKQHTSRLKPKAELFFSGTGASIRLRF